MKETIAALSDERLEAEICSIYYTAWEVNPLDQVVEKNGSILALLWDEFDERVADGRIDLDEYVTGNEVLDDEGLYGQW